MESLQTLNLEWCVNLKALPEGIPPRILPLSAALAILALIGWGITSSVLLNYSLSEGFGQLRSLTELDLRCCYALKELPPGDPAPISPPLVLPPVPFWPQMCLNRPEQ